MKKEREKQAISQRKSVFRRIAGRGMLFVGMLLGMGLWSYAAGQEKTVTLDVKDKALREVLALIKEQTDARFIYSEVEIQKAKPVTVKFENLPLEEALKKVLDGQPFAYEIQGDIVVIKPEGGTSQSALMKMRTVKGSVTDQNGEALAGATVLLKGTTIATATNDKGEFAIDVPDNVSVLVVSFVGYKSLEVSIVNQDVVSVKLEEDVEALEEVVSLGYYQQDKRHLTSSVTSLKMDDIYVPGVSSIDQLLEGHVPGMIYMQNSGQVGATPRLKIRGTTTLLGDQSPLWVLDGVILTDPVDVDPSQLNDLDFVNLLGNAIAGLNPEDVEQIDVLKDAAATAIYGPQASNGVIVITTKKGKVGKPAVTYSVSGTLRQRPRYTDKTVNVMNSKERIDYSREIIEDQLAVPGSNVDVGYEAVYNKYLAGELTYAQFVEQVNYFEKVNTDWLGLLMQDTYSHNHTLSISGGTEQLRYYASLGYMDEHGNIREERNKRYSAMLNLNLYYGKFSMTFGLKGNIQKKDYTPSEVGVMDYAVNTSRAIPAYDTNGDLWFYQKDEISGGYEQPFSIINEMNNSYYDINTQTLNLNVMLKYKFLPHLTGSVTLAYGTSNNQQETYYGEETHYIYKLKRMYSLGDINRGGEIDYANTQCPMGGELQTQTTNNENYSVRADLTYNRYLDAERNHNISASVIGELSSVEYNGFQITRRGYLPDRGMGFADIDFDTEEMSSYMTWLRSSEARGVKSHNLTNKVGLIATASYMYKNDYILNANMRIDASNKFGDQSNDKLLPIWSVSGRWNMHENILYGVSWINNLALKMSYGFQGNMSETESPDLVIVREVNHPFFEENYSTIETFPNPDLSWEKTSTYNVDLEFSLFKNKLEGSVGYYYRHTTNAFVPKNVSEVNGVDKYTVNEGILVNQGFEWTLNFTPINTMMNKVNTLGSAGVQKKGFVWRFNPNFGTVINQLLNKLKRKDKVLVEEEELNYNDYLNGNVYMSGRPVNSFYSYKFKGLNPDNGAPEFYDVDKSRGTEFDNMSNDEILRSVMTRSGGREPFLQGGLNNYIGWNNLSFSLNLAYSIGNKIRLFKMYPSGGAVPGPESNLRRELADRWRVPGDELKTNIPGILSGKDLVEANQIGTIRGANGTTVYTIADNAWQMWDNSDLRVVSGDYLKIQSVSVRYNVPESFCRKLRLKSAYLSFAGSNLYTFCSKKLKGQDPMQSGSSELINVSIRPTYTLQVNVTF